ncbi:MAG TPA: PAS domain S-box protein, partial [Rectinemataceae bacterium]|nr:PAS domain S-box protein [Rectinemataceae bacterium]
SLPRGSETILLVEDEELIATVESHELRAAGYAVIRASTGEAAVALVAGRPGGIDLILMDINLGEGMDGTEAAREILKDNDIPVLFLSSHTERAIVEKTEEISSYGYVVKSSSFTVLEASIKMAFKLHGARRELAEQARRLRESEERYRLLHEQAGIGIAYYSPEGRVISYNEEALRNMGASLDEVVGKGVEEMFPPEETEKYMGRLRRALSSPTKAEYTDEVDLPTGRNWFESTYARICDAEGQPIGVQIMSKNITDRRRSELEEARRDEQLRLALHLARIGVWDWEIGSGRVSWSEEMHRIFGISPEDFAGPSGGTIDRTGEGFRAILAANMAEAERRGITEEGLLVGGNIDPEPKELAIARPDGSRVSILGDAITIVSGGGEPLRMLGITQDISELRRAEDALRDSERRHAAVIENAPVLICEIASDGRYLSANPAYLQVLGYDPAELIGRAGLPAIHPDDAPRAFARLATLIETRGPSIETWRFRHRNGDYLWFECRASVYEDPKGELVILVISADISERRRAEEEMRSLILQKETLMKELQHRVKNSLNVVSSLVELELGQVRDEDSRAAFAKTMSRLSSIAGIYERLYLSEDLSSIDLEPYITELAGSIFETFNPGRIGLRISVEHVSLDSRRAVPLGLILNELIINSLKYAYPGEASGELRIELAQSGGRLRLSVADDGVGWHGRAGAGSTPSLGMELVRMLAQQLRGDFSIEGERGTCARLSFDLSAGPEARGPAPVGEGSAGSRPFFRRKSPRGPVQGLEFVLCSSGTQCLDQKVSARKRPKIPTVPDTAQPARNRGYTY